MKTFECKACARRCEASVVSEELPVFCLFGASKDAIKWREIGKSIDAPAKLTAEVFNRPECPEWARFAAVDKDWMGFYYKDRPVKKSFAWGTDSPYCTSIPGRFDASDWQNSLIERHTKPATAVIPDWVKVGEWVWFEGAPDVGYDPAYLKVTGTGYNGKECVVNSNELQNMPVSVLRPARVRPWTNETLPPLPFIVHEIGKEYHRRIVITGAEERWVYINGVRLNYELLLRYWELPDSSPCGKLEHQNDSGEWVR